MANAYSSFLFIIFLILCLSTTEIRSQNVPKTVTVEQFSNTSCPNCASRIPGFWNTASNFGDDVLILSFYSSSPYPSCPLYQQAKSVNDHRVGHYNIPGSPILHIDGERAPSSIWNTAQSTLQSMVGQSTPLEVKAKIELNENNIQTQIDLIQHSDFTPQEQLVLQVFLVEKSVTAGNLGNYQSHHNVVRAQFSSGAGSHYNPQEGTHQKFSYDMDIQGNWDQEDLAVIAFVQGASGEVYNSDMGVQTASSVNTREKRQDFKLFPNPATDKVTVETFGSHTKTITVYNLLGATIYTNTFSGNQYELPVSNFHRGVYLVRVESKNVPARTTRLVLE
nr:Omp28-related outer membrane protein [Saprospiraceae bacterium]